VPRALDHAFVLIELSVDQFPVIVGTPVLDGEDLAAAVDHADFEVFPLDETLLAGGQLGDAADVDQRTQNKFRFRRYGFYRGTFRRMLSRPLVGVTTSEVRRAERTRPLPEGEPPQHEMALGMPYVRALARAGAVPVVLPPLPVEAVPALLAPLAGVCLSGGPDLDPSAYGAKAVPELGPVEPALDVFELEVARCADALGLPILGICRGAQALNVARGGTLIQHVPGIADGSVEHRQTAPGWEQTHGVRVAPDSRLAQVLGVTELGVNSFHHQAVETLGERLRAVAWAPDGIVEGIEDLERFVVGVQWHGETLDQAPHPRLFEALVAAAAPLSARAAA
jgi:putative glutamine amidotransferase